MWTPTERYRGRGPHIVWCFNLHDNSPIIKGRFCIAIPKRWGFRRRIGEKPRKMMENGNFTKVIYGDLMWFIAEVTTIYTHLKNMKVSWDDEIPSIWKNKIHVPNHQPRFIADSWQLSWQDCRHSSHRAFRAVKRPNSSSRSTSCHAKWKRTHNSSQEVNAKNIK